MNGNDGDIRDIWWQMKQKARDTHVKREATKKTKTECKKKCAVYFGGALHWRLQKVGEWSELPLIGDAFK